jgi:hypothetical protein
MPMNDDTDPDLDLFKRSVNHQSLLYHWHLRSLGHAVESKIEELEAVIYPEIGEGKNQDVLWQRDIDELQLLFAVADWESNRDRVFVTKAVVYKLQYIKLIILPDQNHERPHFHIHYKTEHAASYAIDTLELLAGDMPKKYEKPVLHWASRKQKSLQLTWNDLKAGKDVRSLLLHADEI